MCREKGVKGCRFVWILFPSISDKDKPKYGRMVWRTLQGDFEKKYQKDRDEVLVEMNSITLNKD